MMHLASYKGPATGLLHRLTHWLICHLRPQTWRPFVPADYSHNELVFDIEDGIGNCASSSARDGGVRFKLIDVCSGRWDIKPLTQYDQAKELQAYRWFICHEGDPYDYLGVAAFLKGFSVFLREAWDRWFCSESIAAALGIAHPASLSPQELHVLLTVGAADHQHCLPDSAK